jgi:hypothetical protein
MFHSSEAQESWIADNQHRFVIEVVFVNNGYCVLYKPLRRVA